MNQIAVLFCLVILLAGCSHKKTLFLKLEPSRTGIHFNNKVVENDSINPIDLEFLYNGGGVATGDFNNDGLADLYFTASTTSNKLYLNKGNLAFSDITALAGVGAEGSWCNGASVVDINSDGLQDIYVCTTIKKNPAERRNLFYINQGINKEGIPVFKEMAKEYQLADTSYSVHAAFFDYDNDGDLDMYLLTTRLTERDATQFVNNNTLDSSTNDFDKLFRNDWNDSLQHPVFTDISSAAGIAHHGYGLGLGVADINNDGWKDIYVTNDFFGADLFYINNHGGSFTEKMRQLLKHSAQNAMGNDIGDINNDGLQDIIAVDMNPEDNFRKKKNMNGNNYFIYQNMMNGHYALQYVRNTLQLNQGPVLLPGDSLGDPIFSDIGFLAGIAETDWSWNPSIADFDNDGNRDIIITNGYPKDVTDHDFAAFRRTSGNNASKQELIHEMPSIRVPNYAYKNKGDLRFEKVTSLWGMEDPCFSNGAIYADLDNDGDLDYVINNINEAAFLYENTTNTKDTKAKNYLAIKFKGNAGNVDGIGAFARIYYSGNKMQVYENSPYRGYLSTVQNKAFFGLDSTRVIDSLVITWNNGFSQSIPGVASNQELTVDISHAKSRQLPAEPVERNSLFTDATTTVGIDYINRDPDFIDFNEQRLLPHKLSAYGPALAAGDIDGNGLDDLLISGTGDFPTGMLLQQGSGKFIAKQLPPITGKDVRRPESLGTLLFDADNDGDPDLYLASGSNQFAAETKNYQDRYFSNDGKGNFIFEDSALPRNFTSKSCVKATDYDNDGDLDLFVGGRVLPGSYPLPVSSFIYRNDSRPGAAKFTDVTKTVAPELEASGLTCDATWTDFDDDGWWDLVVVGEWAPIRFYKNNNGILKDVSASSGINNEKGWWNSIAGGDFDNDGDIDYIAGNLGKNSFYRASHEYPVNIYAKDFDKNGALDIITTVYLPDENGRMKEFPAQTRDDQVEQLPGLKKKFLTYKDFGRATITEVLGSEEIKGSLKLQANNFEHSYIENLGGGKFRLHPLPAAAQLAPLYGTVIEDFNHDGNLDMAINGNDFGTEVGNGRYDAMNGLLLQGDGKGGFSALSIAKSGIFIPSDGRALVKLRSAKGFLLLAASQNNGPLKVFQRREKRMLVLFMPGDKYYIVQLKNGRKRKTELYKGDSFLSQSAGFTVIDEHVASVEITNKAGDKRVVNGQ